MNRTLFPPSAILGSLSLVALSLAFSAPAEAVTWNWTFTETNPNNLSAGNGSGTFTTTDTPPGGPFTITAITGIFTGLGNITALLPPGAYLGNNNQLSNTGALDNFGVSFVIGAANYNLYDFGGEYKINGSGQTSAGTFSATPVPFESDALPIVGSVLFMAGGMWWKKKRAQAKVAEFVAKD